MRRKLKQLKLSKEKKAQINKWRRMRYSMKKMLDKVPMPAEHRKHALDSAMQGIAQVLKQKGGK